eukprot:TRINITY_DN95254_c0_g1_i1.p1 TRINITY_DN95254_c0_g1~~TRINITY_DN95254_c0_g1_i1.p1  ORF type:complete len:375 (-),score=45.85 TRINITY_DN95254_c0_g1_i1:85-1209(-)
MSSQNHPFYRIDPSLLPPVGIRSMPKHLDVPATLSARQAILTRQHLQEQSKAFARLGAARIYGNIALPKHLNKGATSAFVQPMPAQTMVPRLDPRLRGLYAHQRPPELDDLIDRIRKRLKELGVHRSLQIHNLFESMDSDHNEAVDRQELVTGFLKEGLCENVEECNLIFNYFDVDGSGSIDVKEFINLIKGSLTEKRRAVVMEAFHSLDVDGNGILSVEDLRLKYCSHLHPDVMGGYRTDEEAFQEFLEGFDVISKEGQITLSEFEHYYEYLSALTASDTAFVNIVRNAWHLQGATGGRCLRVHITLGANHVPAYKRGRTPRNKILHTRQETVEIRPDLNCSVQDPRFWTLVRHRLAEMGYTDIEHIEVLHRE